MPDNSTTPANGLPVASDDIGGFQFQRIKLIHGADGVNAGDVATANPLPVQPGIGATFNVEFSGSQSSDVHGQLVGVSRITHITTKFFQQAPSNFLIVTASGGATATGPTLGAAVFATSTATTAALLAQTPVPVLYAAQYEAWAVLSGAFTAPTSAASFQRLGIYDAVNGYFFGYSGLTFGLTVRTNSVDTFIAQTSWNKDVLAGGASSKFTSNGSPVALAPTNLNMFRIRYGWYGGVSALYEVYAPDGQWVVVHQVRTANSQATVNMTIADLPMTVEVSKTASDATDVKITCGGWAAGITCPASGPNISGQKSIAALNANLTVPLAGLGEIAFSIAGTWVGTLSFQHSLDGILWVADAPLGGTPAIFTTSAAANGLFTAAIASSRFYRVVATAWTSGSASIVYSGSPSANLIVAQTLITDGNNNGPAGIASAASAGNEVTTDRLKVNASLRMLDTSLAAGSQLVAARGDQTTGVWVNIKNASIPVTGTFFQATQPVAGIRLNDGTDVSAGGTHLPVGGSDGTNLRPLLVDTAGRQVVNVNGTVPVSGTFFQATQPVSIASWTGLTDTQLRASAVPVSLAALPALVTGAATIGAVNIAAAQTLATVTTVSAVTAITNALPTGANTIGAVTGPAAAALALNATLTDHTQRLQASTLAVTVTAAANTAATATLPAVAAQFHYITGIEIMRTSTAALAGTATLVVTTSNLPGALAWSFGNAMAAGATQRDLSITFANPIKSSTVNTATTVVMPAPGAAVLWRANVYYYTAA